MADVHARIADDLIEAAREGAGLPGSASAQQVVRHSLATAAGWPDAAVRMAAGLVRPGAGEAEMEMA